MITTKDADVFFSGRVMVYRLALLMSLSIAPVALVVALTWGAFPSAIVTLLLSGVISSALIVMRAQNRDRRGGISASAGRQRIAVWLDDHLGQPSECDRLGVLAVSVEIPESFYDE